MFSCNVATEEGNSREKGNKYLTNNHIYESSICKGPGFS